MASATDLRRRRTVRRELPDGTVETTTEQMRPSYGGPATQSQNETLDYSSLPGGAGSRTSTGFTSQGAWDSFFSPKKVQAERLARQGPTLTPTTPSDPVGMASAAQSSGFFDDPVGFASLDTPAPPRVMKPDLSLGFSSPGMANSYTQAATDLSEQWFDSNGLRPTPSAANPVSGPTTFVSKYGFGTNARNPNYLDRLSRLSAAKRPSWAGAFNI